MLPAEARLRQAEQDTPPTQSSPPETAKQQPEYANSAECATQPPEFAKQQPEYAKQQEEHSSNAGAAPSSAEGPTADERQAQLRAIASDLLYWKGGLKVLRQARLPKWRGSLQWQIEAKIEALQATYARLRAEA